MLSYGLKIAWACLSLTGLLGCWIVLVAFARAVQSYWGPILYCLGCTILQLSFSIGLAWKMDPFLMPRSFCIAQTVLIGFAAFMMTGVCAAFTIATSLAVLRPKSEANSSALAWRHIFAIPLIIFPLLASAAQITVILKLDAVKPTDDLQCDASDPIWVRFLGYAGVPLILCIPCFILSAVSIYRVRKIQGRTCPENSSPLTSIPRRRSRNMLYTNGRVVPTPSPTSAPPMSPSRAPISPGFASPVLSARQFHLPFSPPPTLHRHPEFSGSSTRSSTSEEPDSPASSSFPTFSSGEIVRHKEPIDNGAYLRADAVSPYEFHDHTNIEDWRDLRGRVDSPDANKSDADRMSSLRWARQTEDDELRRSKSDFGFDNARGDGRNTRQGFEEEEDEGFVIVGDPSDYYNWAQRPYRSQDSPSQTSFRPAPNLVPAIWRLILFQLLFTLILLLASISTIIDVATQKDQPTPFGTQHVALILSAWGPALFFVLLPAVRHHLYQMFSPS